jgi:hypothetical protein
VGIISTGIENTLKKYRKAYFKLALQYGVAIINSKPGLGCGI